MKMMPAGMPNVHSSTISPQNADIPFSTQEPKPVFPFCPPPSIELMVLDSSNAYASLSYVTDTVNVSFASSEVVHV